MFDLQSKLRKVWGWHQRRYFVSIGKHGKCTTTTAFRRGLRERGHNCPYDAAVDLKTLCNEGRLQEALRILDLMDQKGARTDTGTYVPLLLGCINMKALAEGRQVHAHIIKTGIKPNNLLGNILVNMYAKCGSIVDARRVFDKMPKRDVVSWNAMISGYAQSGNGEGALELFRQMQLEDEKPDKFTFVSVLKACANLATLDQGKQIHAHIVQSGCELDIFVGSALVNMYAKCGSVFDAHKVFNKMPKRNAVSYNALIAGYARHGLGEEALKFFQQMQQEGLNPNSVTFHSVLIGCTSLAALEKGKQIHAQIIKSGLELDLLVGSTLVHMYAKCGSVEDACLVFGKLPKQTVVSWNALIAGCARHGHAKKALETFWQMQNEGVKPDKVTFLSILNACSSLAALEQAKQIHGCIIESGVELDVSIGNHLLDVYFKCGSIEHARKVFEEMPKRDVVSWTSMIGGYAHYGHVNEAIQMFWHMQQEGVKPNEVTFMSVLNACASIAALEQGKQIHAHITEAAFESDLFVGSSLIHMYAKCGSIEHARELFDKLPKQDVVSWTAMIAGYALHGHGEEAATLFTQMQQEGVKPNDVTILGVLSACSHAGLIDEAYDCFDSMMSKYGIVPTEKHYACMVDLLGRAGRMKEAEDFICKMLVQPTVAVWMALLGAARIHANVEIAKHAAECILELEPQNASAVVLLSNVYAAAGKWVDKVKVRRMMEDVGVEKERGCSYIEINNTVHSFISDDTLHPKVNAIHTELEKLSGWTREAGYIPDKPFLLLDVDEELRECSLKYHSEKLALAFGLISTPFGTPIQIINNLRVCGDCHTTMKFTSSITQRKIIVRDGNRFHHFQHGKCSCGDFW